METTTVDAVQNITPSSDFGETKTKCLTNSEYNKIVNWIDSLINDNTDFILNKYGWLYKKTLSKYPHLNESTLLSIIDAQVQHYVRQHHHRVFNNTLTASSINPPSQSSDITQIPASNTPNQSPFHLQQHNRRLMSSTNSVFERYKELVANSVNSPLITLANNLRMPAMLVAKVVLADQTNEEKLKDQHDHQQSFSKNSILNDSNDLFTDSYSFNDSSLVSALDSNTNDSFGTELETSSNIDTHLSKQLNWLSSKLLSMRKVLPSEVLDQSVNSSTNSSFYHDSTIAKSVTLTTHQLATSTWMINSDPQLAYEVFKCSVIDGHYGSCVEFIKSCTGKRFEQLLKHRMTSVTTDTKLLAKNSDTKSLYTTEKECRVRGLDMTPDMLLNEPIAIIFGDDDNIEHSEQYTATNYIGGSSNGIRVLNWIESKAFFGGPDQLRTAMQHQLFPYWNRHGPGAVIYWFGHILDNNESDFQTGISATKPIIDRESTQSVNLYPKLDSTLFSFWSKYCLLMDGFPAPNRIVLHNHRSTKKKSFNIVSKTE